MKCSACIEEICDLDFNQRRMCVGSAESIECTCKCQVSATYDVLTKLGSVAFGAVSVAAGTAVVFGTGGLALFVGGAAVAGMGTSFIAHPLRKEYNREHMSGKELARDVIIGVVAGAGAGAATHLVLAGVAGNPILSVRVIFDAVFGSGSSATVANFMSSGASANSVAIKAIATFLGMGGAFVWQTMTLEEILDYVKKLIEKGVLVVREMNEFWVELQADVNARGLMSSIISNLEEFIRNHHLNQETEMRHYLTNTRTAA